MLTSFIFTFFFVFNLLTDDLKLNLDSSNNVNNNNIEIVTVDKSKKPLSTFADNALFDQLFPDFPERVKFRKDQQQLFNSTMHKLREAKRIRKKIKLTAQEEDAIAYFYGIGFYESVQDINALPSMFDTRETFLIKMQNNSDIREEFLKRYNESKASASAEH